MAATACGVSHSSLASLARARMPPAESFRAKIAKDAKEEWDGVGLPNSPWRPWRPWREPFVSTMRAAGMPLGFLAHLFRFRLLHFLLLGRLAFSEDIRDGFGVSTLGDEDSATAFPFEEASFPITDSAGMRANRQRRSLTK